MIHSRCIFNSTNSDLGKRNGVMWIEDRKFFEFGSSGLALHRPAEAPRNSGPVLNVRVKFLFRTTSQRVTTETPATVRLFSAFGPFVCTVQADRCQVNSGSQSGREQHRSNPHAGNHSKHHAA